MSFDSFFHTATGFNAFDYQRRLALNPWPELVNVPTGLGKTAAIVLAWLYKRRVAGDPHTPRRLVYCLPMRTLVEQTADVASDLLRRSGLLGVPGEGNVSVHVLMGGSESVRRATWAEHPEEEAILVGTQDQLLSRALMRGYGMSRYQWPMHFALLHNDALWVFDEVQLMGPGLATTAQLEAFRRSHTLAKPSRSVWVSATLARSWIETIDLRPFADGFTSLELSAEDLEEPAVRQRVDAPKQLEQAITRLDGGTGKARLQAYATSLAAEVMGRHRRGSRTLVVLNRVDRAQHLFERIRRLDDSVPAILVHSRFRPAERRGIQESLAADVAPEGQVVVATQAVEAGVDMTSAVMFTELAPWTSIVQRFGRCNRYGEEESAEALWIDIEARDELALPYDAQALADSRELLLGCPTASPGSLPPAANDAPVGLVLRRKDLLELFNTDPDLSGFDVDVGGFIRDPGAPQLDVFWRDIGLEAAPADDEPRPHRDELCSVSVTAFREHLGKARGRDAWVWDALGGRWQRLTSQAIRPGLIALLRAAEGGYSQELGFVPGLKGRVPALPAEDAIPQERYGGDRESMAAVAVELSTHLADAAGEARALTSALEEPLADQLVTAAAWHDIGKAHDVFQETLTACDDAPDGARFWAKSPCRGRHRRKHFRHELASMLAWIEHGPELDHRDLIAYLILAHHGKVRMGLRAMPGEDEPVDPTMRFARGIHEGDVLPEVKIADDGAVPETTMRLDLMEIGDGTHGASWTARTGRLVDEHGPFRLAWLETLVRLADWRASRKEAE